MGLLVNIETSDGARETRPFLIQPEPQNSEIQRGASELFYGGFRLLREKKTEKQSYNMSIHIMGNVLQFRTYEKRQRLYRYGIADEREGRLVNEGDSGNGDVRKECGLSIGDVQPEEEKRRKKQGESERRARDKIVRIVNSNFGNLQRGWGQAGRSVKFLTLTYARNQEDRNVMYSDFVRFIDGLEYRMREKVQYLAVPERQDRGAYHAHVLLYCKYVQLDFCKELWGLHADRGCFKLEKAKFPHNLGGYLAKYIGKDLGEDYTDGKGRKKGEHRYWKSNGLRDLTVTLKFDMSESFVDPEFVHALCCGKVYKCRYSEYFGEYTGKVLFQEMVLTQGSHVEDIADDLCHASKGEYYYDGGRPNIGRCEGIAGRIN